MPRTWLLALLLLAASVMAAPAAAQSSRKDGQQPATDLLRVGMVDVQRVLARSAAGVKAREELERARAQAQASIDTHRLAIEKLRDEIQRTGSLLSPDKRRDKQAHLDQMTRDAARDAEDLQRDLQQREALLVQTALAEIHEVVDRFGKDNGYYLIVEKVTNGVVYAAPAADVTDEIIRLYNQKVGQKSPPLPKKP